MAEDSVWISGAETDLVLLGLPGAAQEDVWFQAVARLLGQLKSRGLPAWPHPSLGLSSGLHVVPAQSRPP